MPELALLSRRVVTVGGVRPAAVLIEGERIRDVVEPGRIPDRFPVEDVGDRVIMAGLVDAHVHVNDPGRTEWEGFETATGAAGAGGVTTIVDMPLNSIPATTSLAALQTKRAAAAGRLWIDCGFWGGVVPGNAGELAGLVEGGVAGCKCFLVPSGVEEFPHVGVADLRAAMPVLAERGVPLLVHAELESEVSGAAGDPRRYATYLASRPRRWENDAIRFMIELCRETGCAVHIVHLSSAEALSLVEGARREGLPFTAETCPHYLFFEAEGVGEGRTEFKCSPPIRERENRERLWGGLREGIVSMVVSDHSPCTPERKGLEAGDFLQAWGGIASLQLRLSAVWTQARPRGFGLTDLALWLCRRPAELAGLGGRKGRLEPGGDADVVVWDPEASFVVEPASIRHRHKLTPYAGLRMEGVVQSTFLRGSLVYDRGLVPAEPKGELLRAHGPLH